MNDLEFFIGGRLFNILFTYPCIPTKLRTYLRSSETINVHSIDIVRGKASLKRNFIIKKSIKKGLELKG